MWEFTALRCIRPLSLRWAGYWRVGQVSRIAECSSAGRYSKLLALLKHVECGILRGSVVSFLSVVERFAMNSTGQWLKVAGGAKGDVLENVVVQAPLLPGSAAVEFGTFIGYTSSRLSERVCRICSSMSSALVFTIEADPVHVAIARHFIDGVLCSSLVEVQPGMVRDVVPLVNEVFWRFVFRLCVHGSEGDYISCGFRVAQPS